MLAQRTCKWLIAQLAALQMCIQASPAAGGTSAPEAGFEVAATCATGPGFTEDPLLLEPPPTLEKSMPRSMSTCRTLAVSRLRMRFMTRARFLFWLWSCLRTCFCSVLSSLFRARSSSIEFCERSGRPWKTPSSPAWSCGSSHSAASLTLPG